MKRMFLLLFGLVVVACATPDQRSTRPVDSDLGAQLDEILRREVDSLESSGLLPYLLELESRARNRGEATALEVEPGIAAILRFQEELGDEETGRILREFSDNMVALNLDESRP